MSQTAHDLHRAADPVLVFREGARDADGQPVEAAPWQEEVLRAESRRHLILVNRQGGKSTVVAARCAWGLVYEPGLYLMIAPSLRQSRLLFKKARSIYKRLSGVPRVVRDNETEMELETGAMLVALPGNDEATIRGFSAPKAVYIDEAARVNDTVFAALRPMLAASQGGRMVAMTTPYGRRGWFFDCWEHGGQSWDRTTITAKDCPHITPAFLEEEREGMSEWQFRAEYLCEFVDTDEAFFSTELIEGMMDTNLEAW